MMIFGKREGWKILIAQGQFSMENFSWLSLVRTPKNQSLMLEVK
jgi:hypothetical protein